LPRAIKVYAKTIVNSIRAIAFIWLQLKRVDRTILAARD